MVNAVVRVSSVPSSGVQMSCGASQQEFGPVLASCLIGSMRSQGVLEVGQRDQEQHRIDWRRLKADPLVERLGRLLA
ncbi:hypothetical protein B7760_05788 (plasmid) [Burkholderia glumae]|nr:hypothetical protein B7760_05788 [Burkholderia glumae]